MVVPAKPSAPSEMMGPGHQPDNRTSEGWAKVAAQDPTPGGLQSGGQTRTKPRLGLQGCLQQKGLKPSPSLCREQGVSLGVRVGQGLEETLPPQSSKRKLVDTVESFLKVSWFKSSAPPLGFGKEPGKGAGHM